MSVPIAVIGAVAVIVFLLVLFIIYKLIQRRRKAREVEGTTGDSSPKKTTKNDDYEKLEEGLAELEQEYGSFDDVDQGGTGAGGEEGGEGGGGGGGAKKKKRRKGKGKGRSGKNKDNGTGETAELMTAAELLRPRLELSVSYAETRRQVSVSIHKAQNLGSNSRSSSEIRITLLPLKRERFKTRSQLSANPLFEEFFTFSEVSSEDLPATILRVRPYVLNGTRRMLVGELRVELATEVVDNNIENQWRELTPAQDLVQDDISDTAMITNPESVLMDTKAKVPMLLISLQYKTVTGKLTVQVIKARHLKPVASQKAPETFVEMILLNSNDAEIASARTSICKGSFHPAFEETFYFPAIEFELDGLTLVFSLFNKKFRRSELMGVFRLGRRSTGEREQLHWSLMMETWGETVQAWYPLTNEE